MTEAELEQALAQAIERELTARQAGAAELQAAAMQEIRAVRLLMQERVAKSGLVSARIEVSPVSPIGRITKLP
jgi:hypothetical protein